MSHVKRRRPSQPSGSRPRRIARKKDERKAWLSFILILILFVSVLAAILFAILSMK